MTQFSLKALSVAFALPMIMAAANGAYAQTSNVIDNNSWIGASLAQAQEQTQGHKKGNMEAYKQKLQQELGLTSEQMQQLQAIKQQGHQQSKALHDQMRAKRQAMSQYMKSPNATEAGALQQFREINNLQRQLGELRIQTWFDMRAKLTPEQAAKFSEMRERKMQQMKDKGHHGGGKHKFGPNQAGNGQ